MGEDTAISRGETVVGVVADGLALDTIIRELLSSGFSREQISLIVSSAAHSGLLIGFAANVPFSPPLAASTMPKAQESEAASILSRSIELPVPGAGPVRVAGPLAAELSKGIPGFAQMLAALGIPPRQAGEYESRIREGNVLIGVRCDGGCGRVRAVLVAHGAIHVRERDEEGPPSAAPPGHYHYQE